MAEPTHISAAIPGVLDEIYRKHQVAMKLSRNGTLDKLRAQIRDMSARGPIDIEEPERRPLAAVGAGR